MGKMIKKKVFVLLFLVLFSLTFISAVPPFQEGVFPDGYTIKYPSQKILKQNQDYKFQFHVFNSSNGIPINDSVTCHFHLYNSSGSHLVISQTSTIEHLFDYEFLINGGNFSTIGKMSYIIQCENDGITEGGFDSIGIEITSTGFEATMQQAVMYGIILFILLTLFIGSLIWFNNIQWGHYTSSEGVIMEVNRERTKKVALFFFTYIAGLLMVFTAKSMTENFMLLNDTPVFFSAFFTILLVALAPITIAVVAIIILTTIADSKLQQAIFRGMEIK